MRVLSRGDSINRCLELCGCGVSKNMLIVEHVACFVVIGLAFGLCTQTG